MRNLLIIYILINSTASFARVPGNCTAERNADGKIRPLSLTKLPDSYSVDFPNTEHIYTIKPSQQVLHFTYKNVSENKKNYLTYELDCDEKGPNCRGQYEAFYNGKLTKRKLLTHPNTRSTLMLDGNQGIMDVVKRKDSIDIHYLNSGIHFRCNNK